MAEYLSANQAHLALTIASGIMLALAIVGMFRGGAMLVGHERFVSRAAGYVIMTASLLVGAWIVVGVMAGY